MRIVLFCEHKYAISILSPLQDEANQSNNHQVFWFVDKRNIPDFSLKDEVRWTNSIQEIYDFSPEAIFVPGNIVPYYLPGVKAEIFHGYAAEKKDHWVIRRYFDLYLTQGPFFTQPFKKLAQKYNDFDVVETGWTRQDWIFKNLNTFDDYKKELLTTHQKKQVVLYAPTFSPSLTSLPHIKNQLKELAEKKDIVLLFKFHPLTKQEWVDEYKQLADENENIVWIDDHNITKYILVSDIMISDTSSAVYEFLLLDRPVITLSNAAKEKYWLNITDPNQLIDAFDLVQTSDDYREKRNWIIQNYDPYLDGKVAQRMFRAVEDFIKKNGVPKARKLNIWRKYRSIKVFGRINKRQN